MTKIITSSPLLLPEQIYNKILEYKNTIMKFKNEYLARKINTNNLFNLEEIINSYNTYIKEKYNPWITKNSDNVFCISNEIQRDLESKGLTSIISLIRQNEGLVNQNTIKFISHPLFVSKYLPQLASLIKEIKSLEIVNNKISASIQDTSKIHFLSLQCNLTTFMKCFGSYVFTGKVISLEQFTNAFSISDVDDVHRFCDYLEKMFSTVNLMVKRLTAGTDDLEDKYEIKHIKLFFRLDEYTNKMYCMFPYEKNYVILSANDFFKRILPFSFSSKYKFAESIYTKVISRINQQKYFSEADDELIRRLKLNNAWLPSSSDENEEIFSY